MFPSPNCNNPFESLLKIRSSSSPSPSPSSSSFPYDQNPTPKHDDLLFNFPSPFLDEHESPLNQIFLQNRGKSKIEEIGNPQNQTPSAAPAPARRRRAGKKDRHSKICTAQGIRDRRMRLSLQVARKFFDLQDMLGYDKASKTIEWLFTQSNKAIKDLSSNNADVKSESFLSECEDLSGIEEINSNAATTPKPDAKASRDKARARARCRTREKMLVKRLHFSGDYCFKPNPNYEHPNPYVGEISPYVGMIDKFLENSISSPSSDYHCAAAASDSNLMGIFGNWDFSSNDRSNCFQYAVANQVTFAANLNSNFSPATAEFP